MRKASIETFATWEESFGLLGTFTSPVLLQVDIHNHTTSNMHITGLCISMKKSSFLFFTSSTDTLYGKKSDNISPLSKFAYKFDIRHILQSNKPNDRFTVKIFTNIGNFESDVLTVKKLQTLKSSY